MLAGDGNAGLYRSTDGGSTWQPANAGRSTSTGLIDNVVRTVWYVPGSPSVALVCGGTGIYRSTDGGQNWTNTKAPTGCGQFAFAYDQVTKTIYATSSAGVLVSTDRGSTWTVSLAGGANEVASVSGTTLAELSDNKLYKLVTGTTWQALSTLPASSTNYCQLAIKPTNPSIIYAALAGGYNCNLYVSSDGGVNFTLINHVGLGTQAVVFSSYNPDRLYVAGDGSAGWTNADGGTSPKYTGVSMGVDTREIRVELNAAGSDDRCYVGSDQGLFVLDPCSTSSSLVGLTPKLYTGWITGFAVSSDGKSIIAMIQDYSAYASNDAGLTWHGLPPGEDGSAAFSPTDPLRCYGVNGGLYVSTDGCATSGNMKRTVSYGSPTYQGSVVAFDPVTPTTLYTVQGQSGGKAAIFVSTDGGTTFTATNWAFTNPYLMVIDPKNRLHMIVGDGTTVSVSFDGGLTWAAATGLATASFYSVALHPSDNKTVVAAVNLSGAEVVYRSADGGKSFSKITSVAASGFNTLAFNTAGSPPYLAMTTSGSGAWLSKDLGTTWERLDTQLVAHKYTAAQWLDGVLYLSTYGQSILKSSAPLQ